MRRGTLTALVALSLTGACADRSAQSSGEVLNPDTAQAPTPTPERGCGDEGDCFSACMVEALTGYEDEHERSRVELAMEFASMAGSTSRESFVTSIESEFEGKVPEQVQEHIASCPAQ